MIDFIKAVIVVNTALFVGFLMGYVSLEVIGEHVMYNYSEHFFKAYMLFAIVNTLAFAFGAGAGMACFLFPEEEEKEEK